MAPKPKTDEPELDVDALERQLGQCQVDEQVSRMALDAIPLLIAEVRKLRGET